MRVIGKDEDVGGAVRGSGQTTFRQGAENEQL